MKLMHIFLVVLCHLFRQTTSDSMYGDIIGANRVGKCTLTSHRGISVMDRVKINEQNKSIATGPLY